MLAALFVVAVRGSERGAFVFRSECVIVKEQQACCVVRMYCAFVTSLFASFHPVIVCMYVCMHICVCMLVFVGMLMSYLLLLLLRLQVMGVATFSRDPHGVAAAELLRLNAMPSKSFIVANGDVDLVALLAERSQ